MGLVTGIMLGIRAGQCVIHEHSGESSFCFLSALPGQDLAFRVTIWLEPVRILLTYASFILLHRNHACTLAFGLELRGAHVLSSTHIRASRAVQTVAVGNSTLSRIVGLMQQTSPSMAGSTATGSVSHATNRSTTNVSARSPTSTRSSRSTASITR